MLKEKMQWFSVLAITITSSLFALPETSERFQCVSSSEYTPYRILAEKDIEGYSVKTDDGAIWTAKDDSGRLTIKSWRVNDTLVIHPCLFPYWSGGKFYLLNERLKTTAVVDLAYKQPYEGSSTSVAISQINPLMNEIEVVDAYNRIFCFTIDSSDSAILSKWNCGQFILFGSNENCVAGAFSTHTYIIINIHTRDYVRASML